MATATAPQLQLVEPAPVDEQEIAEQMQHIRESEIDDFANELEVARIVFRRNPHLVQAEIFPEPYRASILKQHGYDPVDRPDAIDVNDLHLTDPAAAEREYEETARRWLATRHEEKRKERDAQAAAILSRTRPASRLIQ
jgi:hypothetical protein